MNYLIPFILAVFLSMGLSYLVSKLAIKNNWAITKIRTRDVHSKPIPRVGGIAIFISFWLIVIGYWLIAPQKLHFVDQTIFGMDKNLFGLLVASIFWLTIGVIDDFRGIKPWLKLFCQVICGILIVAFGIKIWWVTNPLGGLNIILDNWTYILVPMWIILIMNVVNWFDGIDGLAPSISFITLIILFFLSIDPKVGQSSTALLCIILAGAVLGFLPANWNPARVFLGDTGSGFLGLCLAVFAIISGAKLATAFLVLGIPILDALVVIITRIRNKKSIFSADTSHLHHRFLKSGFSIKQTVLILSFISLLFGLLALKSQTQEKMLAFLWLFATMGIILLALIIIKKFKKNE